MKGVEATKLMLGIDFFSLLAAAQRRSVKSSIVRFERKDSYLQLSKAKIRLKFDLIQAHALKSQVLLC
jgi:hypothetical protein